MNVLQTRNELLLGKTIFDMNLNVGYYARVSTDKDDQLNSLENQSNYFREMIGENKKWNLVGEYIDEGISGTSVKNRDNFLSRVVYDHEDLLFETDEEGKILFEEFAFSPCKCVVFVNKPCGEPVYKCAQFLDCLCPDKKMHVVMHQTYFQNLYSCTSGTYCKNGEEDQTVFDAVKQMNSVNCPLIDMVDYPSVKFPSLSHICIDLL